MFVRITWGRVDPGTWPQFERRYRDVIRPDTAGLLARWLVQDTKDPDNFFAVTLWQTAEAIKTWESSDEYRDVFLAAIEPFMISRYSVAICAVRYGETSALEALRARDAG